MKLLLLVLVVLLCLSVQEQQLGSALALLLASAGALVYWLGWQSDLALAEEPELGSALGSEQLLALAWEQEFRQELQALRSELVQELARESVQARVQEKE